MVGSLQKEEDKSARWHAMLLHTICIHWLNGVQCCCIHGCFFNEHVRLHKKSNEDRQLILTTILSLQQIWSNIAHNSTKLLRSLEGGQAQDQNTFVEYIGVSAIVLHWLHLVHACMLTGMRPVIDLTWRRAIDGPTSDHFFYVQFHKSGHDSYFDDLTSYLQIYIQHVQLHVWGVDIVSGEVSYR
jgi:hypothetical protein